MTNKELLNAITQAAKAVGLDLGPRGLEEVLCDEVNIAMHTDTGIELCNWTESVKGIGNIAYPHRAEMYQVCKEVCIRSRDHWSPDEYDTIEITDSTRSLNLAITQFLQEVLKANMNLWLEAKADEAMALELSKESP